MFEGAPQLPGSYLKTVKAKKPSFNVNNEADGQEYERSQQTKDNIWHV